MPPTYVTISQAWDATISDNVVVSFASPTSAGDRTVIAKIPLDFLRSSSSNTWKYVGSVIKLCVNEGGHIVSAEDGRCVKETDTPMAGQYEFISVSGQVTFAPGPEGKSKIKPPTGTTETTMSNSSRSTANQTSFRIALIARDFNCLVTGAEYKECIAAHIIPFSRTDIWARFGIEYMFTAACGVLIAAHYHAPFDHYRWGFYNPGDGTLIVHYFSPITLQHRQHNGTIIPRERFRVVADNQLPGVQFLAWHYRQCIQTNMRGFYV